MEKEEELIGRQIFGMNKISSKIWDFFSEKENFKEDRDVICNVILKKISSAITKNKKEAKDKNFILNSAEGNIPALYALTIGYICCMTKLGYLNIEVLRIIIEDILEKHQQKRDFKIKEVESLVESILDDILKKMKLTQ